MYWWRIRKPSGSSRRSLTKKDSTHGNARSSRNTLNSSNDVQLFWIPAHVGLEGNERADVLAKEGTTTLPVGPGPMLPVSIAVINERIETYLANLL